VPVWSLCRRELFPLTGIRTADRPARNAVTIPNTQRRIMAKRLESENNHPSPKVTTTSPERPHDVEARTQVTKLALCYVQPYGRVEHCNSVYGRKAETQHYTYWHRRHLAGARGVQMNPHKFFICLRSFFDYWVEKGQNKKNSFFFQNDYLGIVRQKKNLKMCVWRDAE